MSQQSWAIPTDSRDAPSPGASSALSAQVALACKQSTRSPYAVIAADALLAWLLSRAGLTTWAVAWLFIAALVLFGRAFSAHRLYERHSAGDTAALGTLTVWYLLGGATCVWPIIVAFRGTAHDVHYLVTMVMMGLAAGGVGTSAGMLRLYLAWAAPVAVALAGSWISLGSFESAWITVLLIFMFVLLTFNVREYGRTLRSEFDMSARLRAERDRAETERQRADADRKRAEDAIVARTRFFAAASHDLRQPLGVLRWYGDAVTSHARRLDHERLLEIGEGISRALERADPLVQKYLDIARIDARALEISLKPCNVASILEDVREAFEREARGRSIDLHTVFGSPVAKLCAITDEAMLRNILDNLVGNALKFTVKGEVVLEAELSPAGASLECVRVRVRVRDTGIGIPEHELERVFDDFHQVGNPARTQSKGVGLGLAIVRRQAAMLRFELRLTSRLGLGSTFEFDLPATSRLPEHIVASAVETHAGPPMSVLVIDDEPEVRLSLRVMLEAADWTARTASGLDTALEELERGFRPDAIVVDYRLQGHLTGDEVANEIRASGCRVPAVIVTGDTDPDRLSALATCGYPVLHKPVHGDRLIATLVGAIESGRPAQEDCGTETA